MYIPDIELEVGVVRGGFVRFAIKSVLSVIRTWWHDGETKEFYIVTEKGKEDIFCVTGNGKTSRRQAELIVASFNNMYQSKAVVR